MRASLSELCGVVAIFLNAGAHDIDRRSKVRTEYLYMYPVVDNKFDGM